MTPDRADSPDRSRRIHELFAELAALTPEEQRARIAACDDPEVRREVESLLAFDRDDEDDLAPERFDIGTAPDDLPESIGAYRIVREIGRGGMGTVYEAEQTNPRRRVALKVVRAIVATPELLRRFRHEAEVLGRLSHPGIAQIIEAGTFDAGHGEHPFFAMEFVEGESLLAHAASRDLGVRDRLRLFAAVCDAVHHAHRRGVVHRDLKAANILVTATGAPKILDFGVARVTEDRPETMLTQAGQLVGTLGTMSPEQARGDQDVDTSSDVYSLGVVLYELLTGRLPYDVLRKPVHEAIRTILEVEPTPISAYDDGLRGDVETIVHHALNKEKERRYESAAALAGDLRRHLADQPITAVPPTAFSTIGKFARRNRALVAGAALFALTLVGATIVAISLTLKKDVALERANTEAREKERQRADADAVAGFLSELFLDADPKDCNVEEVTALELLDAGYEKLDGYAEGDPLRRARLMEALGQTYRNLSRNDRSEELLRGALALRREHQGDEHADTLHTMNSLGILCRKTGRSEEAIELYRRVLAGRKRLFGPRSDEAAQAMNNLSVALRSLKQDDEALRLLGEATEIMLESRGPEDTNTITQRANYLMNLSIVKDESSVPLLEELYALAGDVHGERHQTTMHVGYCLGTALVRLDRHAEAVPVLTPVLAGQRAIEGERAAATTSTWYTLGIAHLECGAAAEAARHLRMAHALGVEHLGEGHTWVMSCRRREAEALVALGRLDEAEAAARECERFYAERYADDHHYRVDTRLIITDIRLARERAAAD